MVCNLLHTIRQRPVLYQGTPQHRYIPAARPTAVDRHKQCWFRFLSCYLVFIVMKRQIYCSKSRLDVLTGGAAGEDCFIHDSLRKAPDAHILLDDVSTENIITVSETTETNMFHSEVTSRLIFNLHIIISPAGNHENIFRVLMMLIYKLHVVVSLTFPHVRWS